MPRGREATGRQRGRGSAIDGGGELITERGGGRGGQHRRGAEGVRPVQLFSMEREVGGSARPAWLGEEDRVDGPPGPSGLVVRWADAGGKREGAQRPGPAQEK
jgi:hypothetical protein